MTSAATTITFFVEGPIINGAVATADVIINGQDLGTRTLNVTPGGYVDTYGNSFNTEASFSFSLPGLVDISQIKLSVVSPAATANGEGAHVEIVSVDVNGEQLSSVSEHELSGYVYTQALPYIGIFSGEFGTVDPTAWNNLLAQQSWFQLTSLASYSPSTDINARFAINLSGGVAGDSYVVGEQVTSRQAILYSGGSSSNLPDLGGGYSDVAALNNAGQAVGSVKATDGTMHAVLWQNGAITDLGSLGGLSGTYATGINNAGQVVGYGSLANGSIEAFLWQAGSGMTSLADLGGGTGNAAAINDAGQIVGTSYTAAGAQQAVLWQNGKITDLGDLGGGASEALAINARGQVVGDALTATGTTHAFIWQNGAMTDLGTLGGAASEALAINSEGEVVGYSFTAAGQQHAFIWTPSKGMVDLNSWLGGNQTETLVSATGINDLGQIVGLEQAQYNNNENGLALYQLAEGTGLIGSAMTAQAAALYVQEGFAAGPLSISDNAADVGSGLDSWQKLAAAGQLSAISLTDGGIPTVAITSAQLVSDAAAIKDISGYFTLSETAPATSATIAGAGNSLGNTLVFSGKAGQYALSAAGDGVHLTVGGDSLSNIQALQFSDYTLIVAAAPGSAAVTTGNITELYGAVFGRLPDVPGLAYYQQELAANPSLSLISLAQNFLASPEYVNNSAHNYAQNSTGDTQFITDLYNNLLHRAPGSGDAAWYEANVIAPIVGNAVSGTAAYASALALAHAVVVTDFSASAEFLGDVQVTSAHPADATHWLVLI